MRTAALILTYHAVEPGPPPLCLAPELLARHLDCIVASGAPVLTVGELAVALRRGALAPGAVALSFDDGYGSTARTAAPLLAERGLRATVFCVADRLGARGEWAPRLDLAGADELAALARSGWEIGAHGLEHEPLTDLSPARLERELVESRRRLGDTVGVRPDTFAYPFGAVPANGAAALAAAGYTAGATSRLALAGPGDDPFALPRVDAHYLRRPALLRAVLDGRLRPYLGARALGARARRLARPDHRPARRA